MCKVCDEYGGPEAAAKALIESEEIEDVVDFGSADRVVLVKTQYGMNLYVIRGDLIGGMTMVAAADGYKASVFPMANPADIQEES